MSSLRDLSDLRVTAAEYREMPEGGPRYQLIDGRLIEMSPAPGSRHQLTAGEFHLRMAGFLKARPLGRVLFAPLDVYLSDHDVLQPDLVFLSTAHASRLQPHGIDGAPDLVIEILSPSTRRLDLKKKLDLYATRGVREAVYVDLDLDEITVFRFEKGAVAAKRTLARGEAVELDLLPGFRATVDELLGPEEK